jgi:hypothetical protein
MKKTITITISNPIFIPILTFGNIFILFLSIRYFQFLLPLCTGSIITLLSFYLYHQKVSNQQ